MKSIVFIVAHPDDMACGMGGTALLLKDRYDLHVFCVTRGERGLSAKPSSATAARRTKEERASNAFIGASTTFLGEIDGEVFAHRAVCEKVARLLKKIKPVAVFTIWPIDLHPDHAATSEMARKAVRIAKLPAEVYLCEENLRWQARQFEPDLYVDISSVIERKKEMIRCHMCQNEGDGLCTGTIDRDGFRGGQSGVNYAEAFKLTHPIMNTRKPILVGI